MTPDYNSSDQPSPYPVLKAEEYLRQVTTGFWSNIHYDSRATQALAHIFAAIRYMENVEMGKIRDLEQRFIALAQESAQQNRDILSKLNEINKKLDNLGRQINSGGKL